MSVYVDSIQKFNKQSCAIADSNISKTRFTYTVKAGSDTIILKTTDDTKCVKFVAKQSVMLEPLFMSLLMRFGTA